MPVLNAEAIGLMEMPGVGSTPKAIGKPFPPRKANDGSIANLRQDGRLFEPKQSGQCAAGARPRDEDGIFALRRHDPTQVFTPIRFFPFVTDGSWYARYWYQERPKRKWTWLHQTIAFFRNTVAPSRCGE